MILTLIENNIPGFMFLNDLMILFPLMIFYSLPSFLLSFFLIVVIKEDNVHTDKKTGNVHF